MGTTNIGMLGIVPEELKEDNYEYWKVCLKSYLVGNGLWDVVSKNAKPQEHTPEYEEWVKKNALALHCIQLACGPHIYSKYKKETHISAKYAWDHLAEKHRRHPAPSSQQDHDDPECPLGNKGNKNYRRYACLYKAVEDGDWKVTKDFLNREPNAVSAEVSSHGDTVLHIAILAGHIKIAEELVKLMPREGLQLTNEFGATALSLAAISGETKLAKAIVKKNDNLVTIANDHDEGLLPVILASEYGRKNMVHYLYSATPKEELNPEKGTNGTTLLNSLVTTEFYDVASMLLKMYPELGVTRDHHGYYTIRILAHKPSAFSSGNKLVFWKKLIYSCKNLNCNLLSHKLYDHKLCEEKGNESFSSPLTSFIRCKEILVFETPIDRNYSIQGVWVHSPWDVTKVTQNWPLQQSSDEENNQIHRPNSDERSIEIHETYDVEIIKRPQKVLSLLHRLGWTLLRCFVPDLKHIHDRKLINDEAIKLLSCICKEMPNMSKAQLERMEIDKAIHDAIKHGIIEFIVEILKYNPEFIWRKDRKGRTMFAHAIVFRQEKIFSLIHGFGTKKSIVARRHDIFGNNFLHLAAKLSPSSQLERISGAALQMQRELHWFKEVESLVPPKYVEEFNENNKRPSTVFTKEHKELAKEGERWMKSTAGSSMVVGTLIAAVMFSTAFTVPGGNDNTGLPIMLKTDAHGFYIFMLSNALSMFTSSTSVLMFLGILTARYEEKDFLKSLPTKLIFGLSCLFFSIVTMMVSFGSALFLILHKKIAWVSIPIIVFSTFPVVLFSTLQFPLLVEMIFRTYGSCIFDKPKKHHM